MAKSNNIYEQVYNISEDPSLFSRVDHVICILVQRGLLVAGFSNTKELLALNYTGCNKTKPVWELSFFEHLFMQEPLLAVKEKIKGVFVLGNKNLIVPEALYEKKQAENWLRNIHFIERGDVINTYPLKETKASYLLALPVHITELIRINFKKAITLPLPFYQFGNISKQGAYAQCCITAEQVTATLHNNGQLLWHQVFDYAAAEDIAYTIMQVCTGNNIPQSGLSLRCNAISATEYSIINGLSQYFPGITPGNGGKFTNRWDGAIQLANQLFSCV